MSTARSPSGPQRRTSSRRSGSAPKMPTSSQSAGVDPWRSISSRIARKYDGVTMMTRGPKSTISWTWRSVSRR